MTYIAVLFRRSARHWFRLGLGRGEAGGEDRNVCSIWNRSHGTRKLSGKHPLDREKFLSKNKEQRTKYLFVCHAGKVNMAGAKAAEILVAAGVDSEKLPENEIELRALLASENGTIATLA